MGFNYAAQTFEKFALNYSIFGIWYYIFKLVILHSVPSDKFLGLYTIMYNSTVKQYNAFHVQSNSKIDDIYKNKLRKTINKT
jgi:hypothetical protein